MNNPKDSEKNPKQPKTKPKQPSEKLESELNPVYRRIVENSFTGIFVMQNWKYKFVNNKFAEIHGYNRDEMIGMDYLSTIHPDDRENVREFLSHNMGGSSPASTKIVKRLTKNGRTIICETNGSAFNYRGKPAIMGNVLDITRSYLSEQELGESEEKYRTLVESSIAGVFIMQDWKFAFVNHEFASILGYSPEEMLGLDYMVTIQPEDRERLRQTVAEVYAGKPFAPRRELIRVRKDGRLIMTELRATAIEYRGKPAVMGTIVDITEKKLMEERLHNSEQNFRNSINSSPLGILIVTTELSEPKFLYGNQALLDIYGFSSIEELQATPAEQRFTPEAFKIYKERREKRLRGEALPERYEASIVRKDGTIRHLQMFLKAVLWEGQKQNQLIHVDITERKKIEEDLKLKAELLNMATDSIILSDATGTILYANDAACTLHGYTLDELTRINILDLNVINETLNANIREAWEKGILTFETIHIKKDGTEIPLEAHAQIIEVGSKKLILSVDRDISERKKAQEQLIITDRLSTLGNLASGFSHELNNPLSAVIGYAQLLLLDKNMAEKSRADIENILGQAQRIAGIIRNFSDFARGYSMANAPVNLNTIIKKVIDLRSHELTKKNITVITHFADNLPDITVDVNQIQQAFLNLVLNAEYFMDESNKQGTLTITTEYGAPMIRTTIKDDGPGIETEKLSHVFDPFYTTKDIGTGTGLGLTIAYRIIAKHGGTMYADSKPGRGTTFTIELPVKE